MDGRRFSRGFSPLNIAREDKATRLKDTRDRNATKGKGFGRMWPEVMILFVALSMPFVYSYFVVLPNVNQRSVGVNYSVPNLGNLPTIPMAQ
jgi:hypothetical protein